MTPGRIGHSYRDQRSCRPELTAIVGQFDRLLAVGVSTILRLDHQIRLLSTDVEDADLDTVITTRAPNVVILNEAIDPLRVEQLRRLASRTQVLVLAYNPQLTHCLRLLAAGASCVAWDAPHIDLSYAVRLSAQGQRFFVSASGEWVTRAYPLGAEPLTAREQQVLGQLAQGASYAQLALALKISSRTVETHAARIRKKLRAKNNQELLGLPARPQLGAPRESM